MMENEDRELSDTGKKKKKNEGLTCALRLKEERTLQRFGPTAFLAQGKGGAGQSRCKGANDLGGTNQGVWMEEWGMRPGKQGGA